VIRYLAPLLLVLATSAAATPFTGTLTVYVFGKEQAMPAILAGVGSGTSSGTVTIPGGVFTGTAVATTPSNAAPPITGNRLVVTGHEPGSFSGAPLAGAMPLRGRLSLTAFGGSELLRIPLSVVGAPNLVGTWEAPAGGGALTAVGAPWSAGLVIANVPSSMGVVSTSFSGYDQRVAGVGTLQLVTPILVHSTLAGDFLLWSALRLSFAPEPARALLLATGALVLAALGRRPRRLHLDRSASRTLAG
jgi:hypothetical protein